MIKEVDISKKLKTFKDFLKYNYNIWNPVQY